MAEMNLQKMEVHGKIVIEEEEIVIYSIIIKSKKCIFIEKIIGRFYIKYGEIFTKLRLFIRCNDIF